MGIYESLKTPPAGAVKPITGGRLKGKSDINPQWKIEAMTNVFGLCGIGWKHELAKVDTVPLESGEVMVFMQVNVFVKQNDVWSDAIIGMGGDFLVKKEKSGLVANDEAYKMCYTDALGNALKCLGVAADVYRGVYDTKYAKAETSQFVPQQKPSAKEEPKQTAPNKVNVLMELAVRKGANLGAMLQFFNVSKIEELSEANLDRCISQLEKRADA